VTRSLDDAVDQVLAEDAGAPTSTGDLGVTEPVPKGLVTEPLQMVREPRGSLLEKSKALAREASIQAVEGEVQRSTLQASVDQVIEEDESALDGQINALHEASLTRNPTDHAAVLDIAKRTGIGADIVEQKLPEFRQKMQVADFDARKFRVDNPELSKLLLENPSLGPVAFHDETIPVLTKALRFARDLVRGEGELQLSPTPTETASGQSIPMDMTKEGLPTYPTEKGRMVLKDGKWVSQVPMVESPLATDANAAGPKPGDRIQRMVAETFAQGQKTVELGRLGSELMDRRKMGLDTWDVEKKVADIQNQSGQRWYNAGPFEQLALDAAELLPSSLSALKGAGVGAGLAGVGVGGLALGVTKSPAIARTAAFKAAAVGSRPGVFLASYNMERGTQYLDYLTMKTDDGKPIPEPVARGAAQLYGFMSAAVETAFFPAAMKMFGPAGDAMAAGTGKAFFAGLMRNPGARQVFADLAKRGLGGALAEGKEEGLQNVIGDAIGWMMKAYAAGGLQAADPVASIEDAIAAGTKAFKGSLIPGLAGGAVNLGTTIAMDMYQRDLAHASGAKVAALAQVAETSETARAAPQVIAEMVQRETEKSGEKVTNLYVDAQAFERLFQGGDQTSEQAIAELMGEEGPQKLKEALQGANQGRLEVPVGDYLEKWGGKKIAQALAEDTTTRPGLLTVREQVAQDKEIETRRKALVAEYTAENAPAPESTAEQRLVEAVGAQLARTGVYKPAEAKQAVALTRAFLRTQAEVAGVEPDALFADYALTVELEAQAARPATALAQQPAEQMVPPTVEEQDRARWAALPAAQREREMFIDPGTGLRNERAFAAMPTDPARPMVAHISVEGVKYANKAGHEVGNALYAAAAHALAGVVPDVAKVKGDFAVRVKDEAELQAILKQANESMPAQGFAITGALGSTLEEAQGANIAQKTAAEEAGTRAVRGKRPKGLPTRSFAEFLREVWQGPRPDVVSAHLAAVEGTVIDDTLKAAFKAMPEEESFRAVHIDPTTGFLSQQGFKARPKKAHVVSLDLNKLKKINKLFGEAGGDALLKAFADAARDLGATGFDFAHFSGDEYAAQSDDPALLQAWIDDLGDVCDNVSVKMPDGTILKGITFGYGIGADYATADKAVEAHKRRGVGRERKARLGRDRRRGDTDRRTVGGRTERAAQGGVREGRREGESQATAIGPRLAQGERGYVDRMREGMKKIFKVVLTDKADLSTFLHESSHVFLDVMGDLAGRPEATERLRTDWAKTLEWLGVKDGSEITVEQHEKWARAFEAYLREGKAPSASLAGAFQRFKLWLTQIYRALAPGDLDDEIRQVFDRMLATDDEIARMRRAMGAERSLFRTPEEAGMTAAEFQAYLDAKEEAFTAATVATQRKVLKEQIQATRSVLKAERLKAFEDAGREYDARPEVVAVAFLRDGRAGENEALKALLSEAGTKVGLDPNAVSAVVGEDVLKTAFRGLTEGGGLVPDELAEMVGAPDGETLVKAIAERLDKVEWSRKRADELLAERAPDLAAEQERLSNAAAEALHEEGNSDWLLKEWQALRKRRGGEQGQAPLEAIRLAARDIVDATPVGRLYPGRILAAERSAANKAATAAAKGNWKFAAIEKQKQVLNHYLHRETTRALENRDRLEKLAGKLTDRKRREALGKGGKSFLDATDTILEALGFKEPETNQTALNDRASTPEWMKALEEQGILPAFAGDRLSSILARPPASWRDLAVADAEMVRTALSQLWTAARDVNQVMLLGQRVQIEEVIRKIGEDTEDLPAQPRAPASDSQRTVWYRGKQLWQGISAALLDPEQMFRDMGETARRLFWDRYTEQRAIENGLAEHVLKFFMEQWEAMPGELQERKHDLLPASELAKLPYPDDVRRDGALRDRAWMYILALNMGNRSNMDRLLGGYSWDEQAVRDFLAKNMKSEEWDFVEGVWALMDDELYPAMAKQYEQANGAKPDKIEALPFVLPDGRVIRGGYFPARYDPIASRLGAEQREEALTKLNAGPSAQATIVKSFTKGRAKTYADVINLQWTEVPRHVAQVIHYVAFDSYIRDAGRVLAGMQNVVGDRLGEKYYTQMKQWLRVVASPTAELDPEHLRDVNWFLGELRSRFVTSTLGFSLSVAMGDLTNAFVAMAGGRTKTRFAIPALVMGLAKMDDITAKSPELRHRKDTMLANMRKNLSEVGRGSKSAILEGVREAGWWLFALTDRMGSAQIWKGGYEQNKAAGMSEAEAVREADSLVRRMLPSHDPAEQPAILRDRCGLGALIAFMGYFNKMWNLKREILRPALIAWAKADGVSGKVGTLPTAGHAAARVMGVILVSAVIAELLSGRGPEDDEDWAEWAMRKALSAPAQDFPIVGQVGEPIVNAAVGKLFHGQAKLKKLSLRASPVFAGFERLWKAFSKITDDEKEPDDRIWALVEALGFAAKLPIGSSQVGRTGRYITSGNFLDDVTAGRTGEALSGLIYGERDNQPANLFTIGGEQ
jgi:GGDEF domain-containing protein